MAQRAKSTVDKCFLSGCFARTIKGVATWDDVARIVGELPLTTEQAPHDWRVGKKLMAWERPLRQSDVEALTRNGLQPPTGKPSDLLAAEAAPSEPVPVYTGPTKTGTALIAAVAADTEKQTPARRGKKSKIAKKPDAAAPKAEAPKAEAGAKPAKPAAVRHANARPEAAAKPAASADKKPAAKPAADKPAPKPVKPNAAAKPKGENKPAG